MHVGSRQSHSFAAPARVPTCQAKDSVRISHQDAGFVIWNDPRLCAPRELNFVSRAQLSSTPLPPMPCKIMALLANAAAAAAPAALSRLSTRSPSLLTHSNSAAAACFSARSSTFGSSSVFGHRLLASLLGLTLGNSASSTAVRGMETVSASAAQVKSGSSIYDFVVKDISGRDVEMSQYKGKVLLIVNVASACGLTTTNYKELADIYSKYKDQDFEILAFPCNQFGGQEPGTNEQIKEFACTRFKAEYPIFDKINVNGSQEAPLYKYLKAQKGGGLLGDSIKWNFAKFLVDKNGNVVDRYAPTTPPSKIEKDIKKYLSI